MADALFEQIDDPCWSTENPPSNEFIVIQDQVECSGAFLIHHFLAQLLKAGISIQ